MILLFHFSIILPGSTLCNYVLHTLSSSAAPHPVVVRVHRIDGLIYASFTWRYNVQTVRHHDKPPRGIIPLYRNHQSGGSQEWRYPKKLGDSLNLWCIFPVHPQTPQVPSWALESFSSEKAKVWPAARYGSNIIRSMDAHRIHHQQTMVFGLTL